MESTKVKSAKETVTCIGERKADYQRQVQALMNQAFQLGDEGRRVIGGRLVVEEDRGNHQQGTEEKLESEHKVEDVNGDNAGDDDRYGGSKALEDVVRVLHHNGHQEAALRLQKYHSPREKRVAKEEALLLNELVVRYEDLHQAKGYSNGRQLNVTNPKGDMRIFEYLLKIDACKAREKAGR